MGNLDNLDNQRHRGSTQASEEHDLRRCGCCSNLAVRRTRGALEVDYAVRIIANKREGTGRSLVERTSNGLMGNIPPSKPLGLSDELEENVLGEDKRCKEGPRESLNNFHLIAVGTGGLYGTEQVRTGRMNIGHGNRTYWCHS